MSKILIERLKSKLNETGKSARQVSLAVSDSPDTVRNILRGATASPKAEILAGIARELATTSAWLLGDDTTAATPQQIRTDVRPADVNVPYPTVMSKDLPVLGTAAGSHLRGAFQLEPGNVVEYVRRPEALTAARNAYALYIEGTSMVPEHNPGDLRIVHPDRPPRIGDSVIVQVKLGEHSEIEATIGHLRKRTGTAIVIGKINPSADVELKIETVIAVHKVLTLNELFGV